MSRFYRVARPLADRGWFVLPLRPSSKIPAFHGEKSCPRSGVCRDGHKTWEQRATRDPEHLKWIANSEQWRECNVGIATGRSGLLVIDLDVPKPGEQLEERWTRRGCHTGADVLAVLCEERGQDYGALWQTYTQRTARDGFHLFFNQPKGLELRNTQAERGQGLGPLIDTRGHGGQVVAAGSSTGDGLYWLEHDAPVLDLPGWTVQDLSPKPRTASTRPPVSAGERLPGYVNAAVAGECAKVATATSGHKNVLLCAGIALGQLVGAGVLPAGTAQFELEQAAAHMIAADCRCTAREIERTIRNGITRGTNEPRTLRRAAA